MGVISNAPVIPSTAGLSRKRLGAPSLQSLGGAMSFGSLSNLSNLAEPQLTDKNVRKDSKYQFQDSDIEHLQKLGQGAGGTVSKVFHRPTGITMARKVIKMAQTDENKEKMEKMVLRELRIMRLCRSPHIVSFYGAFIHEQDINIMMEFMDMGTLDSLYTKNGPIPEKCVAVITSQLLSGLIYLYDNHKIVHRGILLD
jgi:mitogen-activated protein kinase kinase